MARDRQTQRSLLGAILAEPAEEAPRLVYADWLEENGDPLGELTRVQCELARHPGGARKRSLEARQAQLLRGFDFDRPARKPGDNFDEGRPLFTDWTYRLDRGLVTLLVHQVPPTGAIPSPPGEWFDRFGWFVMHVESATRSYSNFPFSERALDALLASPLVEGCLGLDLSFLRLKVKALRLLAASPRLEGLLLLDLGRCRLGLRGLTPLLASRHLGGLINLDLGGNGLGDAGFAALAGSGAFPRLRCLDLFDNRAGPQGLTALASSTSLAEVRDLHLRATGVDTPSLGGPGRLVGLSLSEQAPDVLEAPG
jgi:uncharacterized protein (TIGR02996 family)